MARRMLIALLVAVFALGAAVPVAGARSRTPEQKMMDKVNHYRHRHGLRKVRTAGDLKKSARRYAWYQMRRQYFGHSKTIHASSKYHRLGEILEIQRGLSPNVDLAFRTWIRSSPHRAIILDPKFNFAGAGKAKGRFHGRDSTIWVMHFGHP